METTVGKCKNYVLSNRQGSCHKVLLLLSQYPVQISRGVLPHGLKIPSEETKILSLALPQQKSQRQTPGPRSAKGGIICVCLVIGKRVRTKFLFLIFRALDNNHLYDIAVAAEAAVWSF